MQQEIKTIKKYLSDPEKIKQILSDGFYAPDDTYISPEKFKLYFEKSNLGNGTHLEDRQTDDGVIHVNFDIESYEITTNNVLALAVHEIWGHGIMGYHDDLKNHHKAYWASIYSRYWDGTTLEYKRHIVQKMYTVYQVETKQHYSYFPKTILINYLKYR